MSQYRVGAFEAPPAEVSRLEVQAELIAAQERVALAAVGLPERGLGIEVGCGTGAFAEGLRRAHPQLRLVGLDYDGYVLGAAGRRLPVVRADARALPFAAGGFDFAYSRLFLRHVPDPGAVLAGISRLVKAEGRVAAIDTSDASLLLDPIPDHFAAVLAARAAWFTRRGGTAEMGHRLPGLFARVGFEDLRVRTVVLDSRSVGIDPFARIVLATFLQAAEEAVDPEGHAAAAAAVTRWTEDPFAFGAISLFVVGGRPG